MATNVYTIESDNMMPPNVTVSPDTESHDTDTTAFIVQFVAIPIVVVFGVLGNVLNIVVLTRKWMRSSTNYYLTSLAIYDILYLVFVLTYLQKQNDIVRVCLNIASNTGVWLTLTFTIERYICVCHPMRGIILCTPKRAKYVIVSVCIAGALVTVPEFFEEMLEDWDSYNLGYKNLNQTLFTYLPLALLCVFNTMLVRSVIRASRRRLAMLHETNLTSRYARHDTEQSRVTTMLIVIVVVFIVCQLPQAIMNTLTTVDTIHTDTDTLYILRNVFNLLVVVNSAVNFVLYSAVSSKFRRTFRHVFLRCIWRVETTTQHTQCVSAHPSPVCTTHLMAPSPAVSQTGSSGSQNGDAASAKPVTATSARAAAKQLVKNDFLLVNPGLRR